MSLENVSSFIKNENDLWVVIEKHYTKDEIKKVDSHMACGCSGCILRELILDYGDRLLESEKNKWYMTF